MKICIFGAGAIGGFLAAHLARVEGLEISVVARGPHLEAIRTSGLKVVSPRGNVAARPHATDDARELGPQDYVFVTLKQHQVTPALGDLASLIGPSTVVLPPTTGIPYWYFHGLEGPHRGRQIELLDPGGRQWQVLGPERAIGCVYWVSAEVTEPGTIVHDGTFANFPIGEPDGSSSPRINRLAVAMKDAGLQAPVVPDIRAWLWMKMISSLCWNPVATLTLATNGDIGRHPDVVDIVRRMFGEAEAVAARFGVERMPMSVDERVGAALSITHHKMSMLQDLERSRPLEVDVLLNSITAMRDLGGAATPTIDLVYSLLKLRQAKLLRG